MIRMLLASSLCVATLSSAYAARFVPILPLGGIPGGVKTSDVAGMSDDGAVLVEMATTATGDSPYRWTEAAGLQLLSCARPPGQTANVLGVSGNGEVVFGRFDSLQSYRWSDGRVHSTERLSAAQR